MRYAMIGYDEYSGRNSGNQVQSLAEMAFLPQVDELAIYQNFSGWKPKEKTKIICNGFFEESFFTKRNAESYTELDIPSESIAFHENVDPLFLSVHIHSSQNNGKVHFSSRVKEYLTAYEPIGTRDLSTINILQENNISSFFSGCLTLTLNPKVQIEKKEYILTTDLSPQMLKFLREKTTRPIHDVSALISAYHGGIIEDLHAADMLLDLLQSAFCVVTPRMHISLPCLALGTPVFLVYRNDFADFVGMGLKHHPRLGGYENLLHHGTEEEYMSHYEMFDLDSPPSNPDGYKQLRAALIEKVEGFLEGASVYRDGENRMTILEKQRFLAPVTIDEKTFIEKIQKANNVAFERYGKSKFKDSKNFLKKIAFSIGIKQDKIAKGKAMLARYGIFW